MGVLCTCEAAAGAGPEEGQAPRADASNGRAGNPTESATERYRRWPSGTGKGEWCGSAHRDSATERHEAHPGKIK